jgi:Fanconi-associated nuclease 1
MEREHKSGRASAKRLKLARDVSSPSDSSHGLEREELATNKGETFDLNGEVPDVLDKATNHHPTELESALPQTQSSRSEIADYEFTRSVDGSESSSADLRGRLNSRKWVKGRSSIYVDAFNLALETVLEEEDHLFDETETEIFNEWLHLSYEAQYL